MKPGRFRPFLFIGLALFILALPRFIGGSGQNATAQSGRWVQVGAPIAETNEKWANEVAGFKAACSGGAGSATIDVTNISGDDPHATRADMFKWTVPPDILIPGQIVPLSLDMKNLRHNGFFGGAITAYLSRFGTQCGVTYDGDIDIGRVQQGWREAQGAGQEPKPCQLKIPGFPYQDSEQTRRMRLLVCCSTHSTTYSTYYDYEWQEGPAVGKPAPPAVPPNAPGAPDLAVYIQGPATVAAGDRIQYRVTVRNDGSTGSATDPMVMRLRGPFDLDFDSFKRWTQGAIIFGGIREDDRTESDPGHKNEKALVTVQFAPAPGQKKTVIFTVYTRINVTSGLAVKASVDPVKGEVSKENNQAAFFSKATPGPDLTIQAITPGGPIDRLRIKPNEKMALIFEVENQGAGPADNVEVILVIPIVTILDVRQTPQFVHDIKKKPGIEPSLISKSEDYIVTSIVTFKRGRLEAGQKTAFVVDVQAPATPFGRGQSFEGSVSASKNTPEINLANNITTLVVLIR
jgi:hypothetical protein